MSTKQSSFSQRINMVKGIYDYLYSIVRSFPKGLSFVLFSICNIIFLIQICILSFEYRHGYSPLFDNLLGWVNVLIDPSVFSRTYMGDYIYLQFAVFTVVICVVISFLYGFFRKGVSEKFLVLVGYSIKIVSSIFFIPMLKILFKNYHCLFFDRSFKIVGFLHHPIEEVFFGDLSGTDDRLLEINELAHSCVEFPYTIFLAASVIFMIIILAIAFGDAFFLVNRLIVGKSWLSEITGRWMCLLRVVIFFECLVQVLFVNGMTIKWLNYLYYPICIILLLIPYAFLIYYLPFFSIIQNFLYATALAVSVGGFTNGIVKEIFPASNDEVVDFRIFTLLGAVILCVIISTIVFICRYFMLFLRIRMFKREDTIAGFLNNTYELLQIARYIEKSKLVNYYQFATAINETSVKLRVFMILHYLEQGDNHIIRAKKEVSQLVNSALNHKSFFPDTAFLILYLNQFVQELDFVRDDSRSVSRKVKRIRRFERNVKKVERKIWGTYMSENISTSKLASLISELDEDERTCENMYLRLLKSDFNNPTVLRAYGKFLYQVKNDPVQAESFFRKADDLEMQQHQRDRGKVPWSETKSNVSKNSEGEDIELEKYDSNSTGSNYSDGSDGASGSRRKAPTAAASNSTMASFTSQTSSLQSGSAMSGTRSHASTHHSHSSMKIKKYLSTRVNKSQSHRMVWVLAGVLLLLPIIAVAVSTSVFASNQQMLSNSKIEHKLIDDFTEIVVGISHIAEVISTYQQVFHESIDGVNHNQTNHKGHGDDIEVLAEGFKKDVDILKDVVNEVYFNLPDKSIFLRSVVLNNESVTLLDGVKEYIFISNSLYNDFSRGILVELNDTRYESLFYYSNDLRTAVYDAVEHYIDVTAKWLNNRRVLSTSFISCFVLCVLLPLPFILFFYLLERRYIKSLMLVPKNFIFDVFRKHGGSAESLEEESFSTKSFSILTKLTCFVMLFGVGVLISSFAFASILWIFASDHIRFLNTSYDIRRLEVAIHEINSLNNEYEHFEYSVASRDVIVGMVLTKLGEINSLFSRLRFGNDERNSIALDEYDEFVSCLYEQSCDPFLANSTSEKLHCYSFEELLVFMEEFFLKMIIENGDLSESALVRRSEDDEHGEHDVVGEEAEIESYFEMIMLLDDGGYLAHHIHDIESVLEEEYLETRQPLVIFNMFVYFGFIFGFTVYYLLVFSNQHMRIKRYLLKIRLLFLELPVSQLSKPVTDALVMDRTETLFGSLFGRTTSVKKRKLVKMLDNFSDYGILRFLPSGRISYANQHVTSLFRVGEKVLYSRKFYSFFVEEDLKKIQDWLEHHKNSCDFSSFMKIKVGSYDEEYDEDEFAELPAGKESDSNYHEVPVHVSIRRHEGKGSSGECLAIVRNIESEEKQKQLIEDEKRRSDELLYNILPREIAENFRKNIKSGFKVHNECTSVFIDICDFTKFSSTAQPEMIIEILNILFIGIDDLCVKHGLEKIKTIGDAYFAVCGIPTFKHNSQKTSFEFSVAVIRYLRAFNLENQIDFHVTIGINAGKLIAGVIGKNKWCYDVWGDSVNLASRLQSLGEPDHIHVSRNVYSYLYKQYKFRERTLDIKGIGVIQTYLHHVDVSDVIAGFSLVNMKSLLSPSNSREILVEMEKDEIQSQGQGQGPLTPRDEESGLVKIGRGLQSTRISQIEHQIEKLLERRKRIKELADSGEELPEDLRISQMEREVDELEKVKVLDPVPNDVSSKVSKDEINKNE